MIDEVVRSARLARAISESIDGLAKVRQEGVTETVRWLAGEMHVSARTVNRWMSGQAVPDALEVQPLAKLAGVSPMLFVDPPAVPQYPLADYLVPPDQARTRGGQIVDRARAKTEAGGVPPAGVVEPQPSAKRGSSSRT